MENGTYSPPSLEKNIRSFEHFPVSRENIILPYKPYGRLGYGEASKFSRENSINSYKGTVKRNKENRFKNLLIYASDSPQTVTPPNEASFPPIETWSNFPSNFPQEISIFSVNQAITAMLRETGALITS